MKLTIRLTGSRFENPLWCHCHDSFSLLSFRHAGCRFAVDLECIAQLGFEGGLKCCRFDSIRVEPSPLLSIRHTESRFARNLKNITQLGFFICDMPCLVDYLQIVSQSTKYSIFPNIENWNCQSFPGCNQWIDYLKIEFVSHLKKQIINCCLSLR